MDFRLNDEQLEFQRYCRRFAEEVIRPIAAKHDREQSVPWEAIKAAWGSLRTSSFRRAADADAPHAAVTSQLVDLIENESCTNSNLLLDQELDSYWLMGAWCSRIPAISEAISGTAAAVRRPSLHQVRWVWGGGVSSAGCAGRRTTVAGSASVSTSSRHRSGRSSTRSDSARMTASGTSNARGSDSMAANSSPRALLCSATSVAANE